MSDSKLKSLYDSLISVLGNIIGRVLIPIVICGSLKYPAFGLRVGASTEWVVCAVLTYIYYIYTQHQLKEFI